MWEVVPERSTGTGSVVWPGGLVAWRPGEEAAALSLLCLLVSSLICGSDFPKAQLWFCSPQNGPWAFWPVVSAQCGAVSLEPNCLDLLSEGRRSRKCWHLPGLAESIPDSWQPARPTPGPGGYRLQDG